MSLTSFTSLPILRIHNDHIERFTWTLPPDNLLHWFTSESDDSNMKIDQPAYMLLTRLPPYFWKVSEWHQARKLDMLSQSGHPLNSSMEIKLYGYEEHMFTLVDTTKATMRQIIPWLYIKHYKERRWAFIFTNVIFWHQKVFSNFVPEIKPIDIPLFLSKMKICLQHSTTYHWTILETKGIRNPIKISMSFYY